MDLYVNNLNFFYIFFAVVIKEVGREDGYSSLVVIEGPQEGLLLPLTAKLNLNLLRILDSDWSEAVGLIFQNSTFVISAPLAFP